MYVANMMLRVASMNPILMQTVKFIGTLIAITHFLISVITVTLSFTFPSLPSFFFTLPSLLGVRKHKYEHGEVKRVSPEKERKGSENPPSYGLQ